MRKVLLLVIGVILAFWSIPVRATIAEVGILEHTCHIPDLGPEIEMQVHISLENNGTRCAYNRRDGNYTCDHSWRPNGCSDRDYPCGWEGHAECKPGFPCKGSGRWACRDINGRDYWKVLPLTACPFTENGIKVWSGGFVCYWGTEGTSTYKVSVSQPACP